MVAVPEKARLTVTVWADSEPKVAVTVATPPASHGAAAQTQGDSRRSVVINNRARAGGGGEGRIGWVGEIDGEGLVGLVHSVAVDGDGDGFGRLTGIKGERGGWDGHVV